MSQSTLSKKVAIPIPPLKGSFPLDHYNSCKETMIAYFRCLDECNTENNKCRLEAKAYFECRMEKGLMDQEDFSKLGYSDVAQKKAQLSKNSTTAADS